MTSPAPPSHSRAVEDYVKHIFKLTNQGERATTKALSERMALGQGTVSGMLKQLAERGLVEHQPYYGVTLTEHGRALAMRMIRRHRLIELFLVKTLELPWHEVDEDAERLEHAVSDQLIERIDAAMGYPEVDPHGSPIPTREGRMNPQDFHPLIDLDPGQEGIIRRVSDSDPRFLEFLHDQDIKLNDPVHVVSRGPFGSIKVRVNEQQTQLPREAAERIAVSIEE